MVTKQHILEEIRRTASENGGSPLGRQRFAKETGIKEPDWRGRFWARWGDAIKEAGLSPNQFQEKFEDAKVIGSYVPLIRKYGRLPTSAEIRLERSQDPKGPNYRIIERLGSKQEVAARVSAFCKGHPGYEDVIQILASGLIAAAEKNREKAPKESEEGWGFVYLFKSGKFFKLGRTVSTGMRERQFQIQLPERPKLIHEIKTDDPVGIERYWHERFAARRVRKEAEFFALTAEDVAAFKRRKFM